LRAFPPPRRTIRSQLERSTLSERSALTLSLHGSALDAVDAAPADVDVVVSASGLDRVGAWGPGECRPRARNPKIGRPSFFGQRDSFELTHTGSAREGIEPRARSLCTVPLAERVMDTLPPGSLGAAAPLTVTPPPAW